MGNAFSGHSKWRRILDNYDAVVDPSTSDNFAAGYGLDSKWLNTVSRDLFVLVGEFPPGVADWRPMAGVSADEFAIVNVTKTVQASGGDFATLEEAAAWFNSLRLGNIPSTGASWDGIPMIKFQLAAETYNLAEQVTFSNPDFGLNISGATTATTLIVSAEPYAWGDAAIKVGHVKYAYFYGFTLSSTVDTWGGLVLYGVNGGCWISSSGNNKVEIKGFMQQLVALSCGHMYVDSLEARGDGNSAPKAGSHNAVDLNAVGSIVFFGCTIDNADQGILAYNTQVISIENTTVDDCDTGVSIVTAGRVSMNSACIVSNCTTGISASLGARVTLGSGLTFTTNTTNASPVLEVEDSVGTLIHKAT